MRATGERHPEVGDVQYQMRKVFSIGGDAALILAAAVCIDRMSHD